MDLGIRGKVALVTGASAGIGEAVAQTLAREGVKIALAARRPERLKAVAAEALRQGALEAREFVADLTDPIAVDRLFSEIESAFGDVEILVANGGGPKSGAYLELDLEDWDGAYLAIFRSMIQLVNHVLPAMQRREWGRIVALTSTSVRQPIPDLALSNAFRTGLTSALKTLAAEVASKGITVNTIATGRVLTDRLRTLYAHDDKALQETAKVEIPIGRAATPEEFAPRVAFLCGEPARYVTGQTIAIDGGLIRGLF